MGEAVWKQWKEGGALCFNSAPPSPVHSYPIERERDGGGEGYMWKGGERESSGILAAVSCETGSKFTGKITYFICQVSLKKMNSTIRAKEELASRTASKLGTVWEGGDLSFNRLLVGVVWWIGFNTDGFFSTPQ